jgi:predicted HAD superfamily Cof-like phosphohydrolase
MSVFKMTEDFCREVIGINRPIIQVLEPEEKMWLLGVLHEEIIELDEATSIVDQVDALIDLIYFAAGGLTRLGIPAEASELMAGFVHKANMTKVRGVKNRAVTSELDAVKPEGWQPPEGSIAALIQILKGEEA